MVFLVGWVFVLLLLALWSGFIWAAQSLLAALLSEAGRLGAGGWRLPEALTDWLPVPVAEWLAVTVETLTPQLQWLAEMLPSLSGGVTVLAWVAWGLGALVLLAVGLAIHVGVALWRKSSRSSAAPPTAALR